MTGDIFPIDMEFFSFWSSERAVTVIPSIIKDTESEWNEESGDSSWKNDSQPESTPVSPGGVIVSATPACSGVCVEVAELVGSWRVGVEGWWACLTKKKMELCVDPPLQKK